MSFFGMLSVLASGLLQTCVVTILCSIAGFFAGLVFTVLRRSSFPGMVALVDTLVYVLRSVPLLVLLFLVYFGLPSLGLRVPPLVAMVLSLGLIAGAYISEIFRGALASVDPNEVLAAHSAGMTKLQVLLYVEFPQMLRFSFPSLMSEFTSILKYSPFAYTVGIPEITKEAMSLASTTLRGVEIYFAVGFLYYAIYRVFLIGFEFLERRLRIPGIGN